jgi:hypothetical protein
VNDDECLALLVATDDPVNCEWPGGYEADAIRLRENRFKAFAADLEARLTLNPPIDDPGDRQNEMIGSTAVR